MRLLVVPAVLLLLLPSVQAHGSSEVQTHLSVRPVSLEAGGNVSYAIETGEGPWQAGMVFVIYVQFHNDARNLRAELVLDHSEVVANWTFEGSMRHKASVRIPLDEGPYEMRFTNLAAGQTQFYYYFDQTCNCTFKPVPLDEGWVVFHYDLRKGRSYKIGFPLVQTWTVEGVLATQRDDRGDYPDDFGIIENKTASGPEWLNFTVTPKANNRYLLFLTALSGSPATPNPSVYVSLTPLLEQSDADAPGPAVGVLLAALLAFAALRRRG